MTVTTYGAWFTVLKNAIPSLDWRYINKFNNYHAQIDFPNRFNLVSPCREAASIVCLSIDINWDDNRNVNLRIYGVFQVYNGSYHRIEDLVKDLSAILTYLKLIEGTNVHVSKYDIEKMLRS